MRMVLASGSPRRRELMDLLGVSYEVIPSTKEEIIQSQTPEEAVKELSMMKAVDVAENHFLHQSGEEILVIGADTVVACDDQILGKPKNEANAKEILTSLAGRGHSVFTGLSFLWIADGKIRKTVNKAVETKVFLTPMTAEEIDAYVATGEPMDKAGAYAIQGKFAPYVTGIEGDYYNVVGFPICTVWKEIKKAAEANS